jgi:ABC-2 type transport system ATP-binding protein
MVERKRRGASFLISSHILSTLAAYCDRYVVLKRGEIAAKGSLDDLRRIAGADPEASLDDTFYALVKGGGS